jgi:hypothetical protein
MTIDPMVDFVVYQSPYAFADNNPVKYVDEYGLGVGRWLRNIFKGCDCKGKGNGFLGWRNWGKPGYKNYKVGGGKKRRNNKKQSTIVDMRFIDREVKEFTDQSTSDFFNGLTFGFNDEITIPDVIEEEDDVNVPPYEFPIHKGKIINGRVTFDESIQFITKTDEFNNVPYAEKILKALIKTLKLYPLLDIDIKANISQNPWNPWKTGLYDNSGAKMNGKVVSPHSAMNTRAKAIRKFFTDRGIDISRISISTGEMRNTGQKGRTATFELINNK